MTVYTTVPSPVGELLVVGEPSPAAKGGVLLRSVSMPGQRTAPRIGSDWVRAPEVFADAARELDAYFAGAAEGFDLDLDPVATGFQQRVWVALDAIPYGTTTTYGALAAELGLPRDRVQALGAAIGANPLLIVRPCHRVIGADGKMRGYAGGVERKQQLLALEGALQPLLV